MIVLYTIDCPNCKRLEKKLDSLNIRYDICKDEDIMISKGFKNFPILEVDDKCMGFKEAMKWANDRKETV